MSTVSPNFDADTSAPVDDPTLATEYPLTPEQVRCMHEHGWAFLPGLISNEIAEQVRAHLLEQPLRPGEQIIKALMRNPNEKTGVVGTNTSHDGSVWRDPFFFDFATSRRVAGTAVRLMKQPDALVAQDVSFTKAPGGGPTQPHQDYSYWPFDRRGELSIWIALVDISEDMGPLYYLEDSHREGPLGMHGGGDIRPTYPHLWESTIVGGKALAVGDAQAHWDLTVHGARANTSDRHREAYSVRYIRSDTIYSGIGYPHYDSFEMKPGTRFADHGGFPRVDRHGLTA